MSIFNHVVPKVGRAEYNVFPYGNTPISFDIRSILHSRGEYQVFPTRDDWLTEKHSISIANPRATASRRSGLGLPVAVHRFLFRSSSARDSRVASLMARH